MSKVTVLDASAVLAYLQQEPGADRVEAALDAGPCWLGTVNLCEVLGKLHDKGMPPRQAEQTISDLGLTIVDFTAQQATLAALLRRSTGRIGASLGDRACLALAHLAVHAQTTATVVTAERAWTRLKWTFPIVVIR